MVSEKDTSKDSSSAIAGLILSKVQLLAETQKDRLEVIQNDQSMTYACFDEKLIIMMHQYTTIC